MAAAQKKKSTVKKTASSRAATGSSKTKKKTNNSKKAATRAASKSTSASKKKYTKESDAQILDLSLLKDVVIIIAAVAAGIMLISCFVSQESALSWLRNWMFRTFGFMSFVFPILMFLLVCFVISNWKNIALYVKLLAIVLTFIAVSAILSILHSSGMIESYGGGIIGDSIIDKLSGSVGLIGSYLIMAAVIVICMRLFWGRKLAEAFRVGSRKAYDAVSSQHQIIRGQMEIQSQERTLLKAQRRNQTLEQQQRRLEELQALQAQEKRKGESIREFTDITLDDWTAAKNAAAKNDRKSKPEDGVGRQKRASISINKELRTNSELEKQDEKLTQINITEEKQTQKEEQTQLKDINPTVTIEGTDVTEDFSQLLKNDYRQTLDSNEVHEDSAKGVNDESRNTEEAFNNELDADEEKKLDNPVRVVGCDTDAAGTVSILKSRGDLAFELESSDDETELYDSEGPEMTENDEPVLPDQNISENKPEKNLRYKYDEGQTKTVVTASGKVITVDLDGLPGENKRPRDPVKVSTSLDQYDEKVVPIAYEEPKEYIFPPTSLLRESPGGSIGKEEIAASLKDTARKLQQTLHDFGVGVTITNISRGPSVTRYELQPEQGVKVSRIVNLTDDIKLNLAAEDIRIEAPIPGKAAIGIEVPNKEKVTVGFKDLIVSDEFTKCRSKTIFAAGKDIAGKTVIADIEKMPHLLIAGATGSGKSVCINTIIMSVLYKAKPSEVKLILIDPKVVELSVYNGIPHLLIPVVTDPKKAAAALNWAVNEMEERYKKFSELKTRNIVGYNNAIEQLGDDIAEKDKPQKLPQIIVIVDELADLIMTAANEVEDAIQRLAQKARAAGIHLIIATQRPSVNVITGVIKANIPSRIAFSVSSGIDSRTIIDMNGAEKLLGKGDMLFYPYYVSKPMRVQGAFVSDEEVSDVVSFLQEQKNVIGGAIDNSIDLQTAAIGSKLVNDDNDELFETAGYFIIEQDKASIGNLQRHLRIGFNRAARIMDQLYAAGVVSKDEGTKPRKVLMTKEQFEEYISEM